VKKVNKQRKTGIKIMNKYSRRESEMTDLALGLLIVNLELQLNSDLYGFSITRNEETLEDSREVILQLQLQISC